MPIAPIESFSIVEASIDDLRRALDQNFITSVELVSLYLNRIAVYDRKGKLNSIPILNLSVFEDAANSDERRANGLVIGPLDGIPFTVKDSYKVKGMTVASGSPAFKNLIANEDAFSVQKLRDVGAVLVGKTNMPPMAAGGMQRGFYGRAESPYNSDYLTAAFGSGSSNGSATSTAASFAAFGMAEETVSSGRAPASNNALVAYTPSRGLLSIRGNWPLYPTCDVVVPHTRSVQDLLHLLDVIMVKDECTTGDFWRNQPFIKLPQLSDITPASFGSLAKSNALQSKRIGVPKIYIGQSESLDRPIKTRQSILDLWYQAKRALEKAGATVIETELPIMTDYDDVSMSVENCKSTSEGTTKEWNRMERRELIAYGWDDFLIQNGDPAYPYLSVIDPTEIFPPPPGALPDRYAKLSAPITYTDLVGLVSEGRVPINELPGVEAALTTLENRRKSFESWLQAEGLDCIVFPANSDVGPANSDTAEKSADEAWRNGAMYSNGNRVIRHLGIPTVSVPMGIMEDIGMPVNLTFAGKGYDDVKLLELAFSFEDGSHSRRAPTGTPQLDSDIIRRGATVAGKGGSAPVVTIEAQRRTGEDGIPLLNLNGTLDVTDSNGLESLVVTVDGRSVDVSIEDGKWELRSEVKLEVVSPTSSAQIDKTLVVAVLLGKNGRSNAKLLLVE